MDADIGKYAMARVKSPTDDEIEEEKSLIGRCVARLKTDASIVASAASYVELVQKLKDDAVDLKSVVLGFVDDPEETTLRLPQMFQENSSSQ